MTTHHDFVESIFARALELQTPDERSSFLDAACEGDLPLLSQVEALLSANEKANSFMDVPVGIVRLPDDDHALALEEIGERPGDRVGKYKLLQHIGEGGMGTVFMAEQDEPVQRKVALKIVKPGLDTKEVIARFEAERRALALMDHQNIARVLDAGATASGRPYFVMELVQGISITEYCDDAKLSARERLELFIPICKAIQHAHQKGIIHRDIKPHNVMVTLHDGEAVPKVIDFGIAKATDRRLTEKTLFTRYGEFFGTPAYMSPEQAQLSGLDVDTRSDVYALGALLYELLSGVPPFDTERLKTMGCDEMRRVIREETPPAPSAAISTMGLRRITTIAEHRQTSPRELRFTIRGELDWIVSRAMNKDRARRYETARALADDVRRYLNNETIAARPPSLTYRFKKFLGRNRAVATIALTLTAALITTTCISTWWAWRAMSAEKTARDRYLAVQKSQYDLKTSRSEENRLRALAEQRTDEANRALRHAADEAENLKEVIEFISHSLFAQAGPSEEPDRNIKLRTVLDRAAERLDDWFITRPRVESAIQTTIGETYRGIGEYEKALHHLQRAWSIHQAISGTDDSKTIAAANNVARVHLHLGQYDEAEPILRTAVERTTRLLGEEAPETLNAMNLSAWRYEAVGELARAEDILAEVLHRRSRSQGDVDSDTYMAMNNLAYVYQSQGRLLEAEPLLLTANEGIWKTEGDWHPDTLAVMNNLASLYTARGEIEAAEQLYIIARQRAKQLLGPEHRFTLIIEHSLALIYAQQGKTPEAEQLLFRVLRAQHKTLGVDHPNTLTSMHNLARLYQVQGHALAAESLYKTVLGHRRTQLGEEHPTTLTALNNLAYFYLEEGRFSDALPHYSRTVELVPSTYGPKHPNSLIAMAALGLCLLKTGDRAQAEIAVRDALGRIEGPMQEHWLRYVVEGLLGEVLLEQNQRKAAEAALLHAYEGLKTRERDVPIRWKSLGMQAALQRLIQFHRSADSPEQRSLAKPYREELHKLKEESAWQEKKSHPHEAWTRNKENGKPI